jgi:hypothetical protein
VSSMKNPVDFMISQSGLNRAEFSVKYGYGKNTLTRVSQGRLQSITSRVESDLWAEWREKGIDQDLFDAEYNTLSVDSAYQRWVTNRRVSNRVKLPAKIVNDTKITPFARLVRAIGSISKTAQTIVVADVVVQRYADGRQKQMPEAIKQALTEMRYPHVQDLEKAQQKWHARD